MVMWIPQDPYHTGALHAFQLNLNDIPIITRNNKQSIPIMAIKTRNNKQSMPIMAIKILNAPCLKKQQQSNNVN